MVQFAMMFSLRGRGRGGAGVRVPRRLPDQHRQQERRRRRCTARLAVHHIRTGRHVLPVSRHDTFLLLPVILYVPAILFLGAPFKFIILPAYLTIFFMPMGVLRVAMFQTIEALSPVATIRSILKVPTPYMVVCMILMFLVYARAVLGVLLMAVPYVGGVMESIIGFFFLILEMRVLGLLYYAYQDRFNWFSEI